MPMTGNSGGRSRALDHASALACGSASTTSTRHPEDAKCAARLRLSVVFPTPPFWLSTPMIMQASVES
jgi:hypothetical protein